MGNSTRNETTVTMILLFLWKIKILFQFIFSYFSLPTCVYGQKSLRKQFLNMVTVVLFMVRVDFLATVALFIMELPIWRWLLKRGAIYSKFINASLKTFAKPRGATFQRKFCCRDFHNLILSMYLKFSSPSACSIRIIILSLLTIYEMITSYARISRMNID